DTAICFFRHTGFKAYFACRGRPSGNSSRSSRQCRHRVPHSRQQNGHPAEAEQYGGPARGLIHGGGLKQQERGYSEGERDSSRAYQWSQAQGKEHVGTAFRRISPSQNPHSSPQTTNRQRQCAVDQNEDGERNRDSAQRERHFVSFRPGSRCSISRWPISRWPSSRWPSSRWPSSRRLRSTSSRKSSSNCASRSPRISTRNESGKVEAGLASSN